MQVRVEDPATWSCDWSEDSGWNGPKLMYMAGLFDEWSSVEVCKFIVVCFEVFMSFVVQIVDQIGSSYGYLYHVVCWFVFVF